MTEIFTVVARELPDPEAQDRAVRRVVAAEDAPCRSSRTSRAAGSAPAAGRREEEGAFSRTSAVIAASGETSSTMKRLRPCVATTRSPSRGWIFRSSTATVGSSPNLDQLAAPVERDEEAELRPREEQSRVLRVLADDLRRAVRRQVPRDARPALPEVGGAVDQRRVVPRAVAPRRRCRPPPCRTGSPRPTGSTAPSRPPAGPGRGRSTSRRRPPSPRACRRRCRPREGPFGGTTPRARRRRRTSRRRFRRRGSSPGPSRRGRD